MKLSTEGGLTAHPVSPQVFSTGLQHQIFFPDYCTRTDQTGVSER